MFFHGTSFDSLHLFRIKEPHDQLNDVRRLAKRNFRWGAPLRK